MADVVNLVVHTSGPGKPVPEVIDLARRLLEGAEKGEISALAVACADYAHETGTHWAGVGRNWATVTGAVSLLLNQLCDAVKRKTSGGAA